MSFAAPWALLFSLAAVPVVVLYILKVRARRVAVPTLLFWEQVFDDTRPRSVWRWLRHWVSLLLQILFLALLVLALARPQQIFDARHIVLIIDNGASMSGRRAGETRLDEARRRAIAAIDELRFFDSMTIMTAADPPRVVCPTTGRQRALRDAVAAIDPATAPARIDQSIAVARRIVEAEDNASIVLIGDQPADGVKVIPITGDTDNVAITRFAVRRSLIDPVGYAILAEARNFGRASIDCRVELALDGDIIDVFALSLTPDETWSHVMDYTAAQGGQLTATIDRPDALAADNVATITLPHRARQRVMLNDDNLFLTKVIESIPLVQLASDDADVTVFHGNVPAVLPPGNVLVINPSSSTDCWQLGEPLRDALVAKQDTASPLMAHVRLDNVSMPQARRIEPAAGAHVLAEAVAGEPIYFAIERDGGNVLVLTADLAQSDLPLRTAFPIMMTNAMNWFAGNAALDIASTTFDPTESDLRAPDGFVESDMRAVAGFGGRPMWFYLLVAACMLAAIEWWLYQRRWIG